jgi:hypothetical protein
MGSLTNLVDDHGGDLGACEVCARRPTLCADGLNKISAVAFFAPPTTQLEIITVSLAQHRGRIENCAFVVFRSATPLWRSFT